MIFIPDFAASGMSEQDLHRLTFLVETQRIMAFLDDSGTSEISQRSWASIENLTGAITACGDSYVDLAHADFLTDAEPTASFLRTWEFVTGHYADSINLNPILKQLVNTINSASSTIKPIGEYLFTAVAVVEHPISSPEDSSLEQKFSSLDVILTDDLRGIYSTLTGYLDNLIWSEEPEAYLKTVSHLFTMNIHQENGMAGAGIDLPIEWYPDRYTLQFKDVMRKNMKRRSDIQNEIEELRKRRNLITNYSV